ncbi:hypothetical protein AXG93_2508s1180 [Marchantia polymorpha subsp. ruderalis]|uniref:Uncharacterized protein n=1 Tax=Marchantia polymorpha subsp. ruderalis TaxID=1480154 RepID=A0A176WE13_MARPO|nr:hypothetical protein AXG93_2508s1180 [Marchantia polymorpha subsp. ruderalis]
MNGSKSKSKSKRERTDRVRMINQSQEESEEAAMNAKCAMVVWSMTHHGSCSHRALKHSAQLSRHVPPTDKVLNSPILCFDIHIYRPHSLPPPSSIVTRSSFTLLCAPRLSSETVHGMAWRQAAAAAAAASAYVVPCEFHFRVRLACTNSGIRPNPRPDENSIHTEAEVGFIQLRADDCNCRREDFSRRRSRLPELRSSPGKDL